MRADPAVLDQALKMMQNPMVMEQMKVMMQDPAVKERMQRMLQRMGSDSAMPGAEALGNDPAALDKLFERMQDPEVIDRLQTLAKNETFQAKVQEMTKDPAFAQAAGQYASEMADDVMAEAKAASVGGPEDDLGFEDTLEDDEDDDEDGGI